MRSTSSANAGLREHTGKVTHVAGP